LVPAQAGLDAESRAARVRDVPSDLDPPRAALVPGKKGSPDTMNIFMLTWRIVKMAFILPITMWRERGHGWNQ